MHDREAEAKRIASMNLEAFKATQGLTGRRIIIPDTDDLVDRVAAELQQTALSRASTAGAFHLALSGGSTPQALYQRLMIDPRYRAFPWKYTHLWIVDERVVPFDHDKSNYNMIREMIIEHSDIPAENVHPMPVMDDGGDQQYEADLHEALDHPAITGRLDYVLLGMGGDGHTASLFPRTAALAERDRWVVINDGETVAEPRPRMTMTYPLINAARFIGILVTGEGKYATLQHVSLAKDDVQRFPITGVHAVHEDTQLIWYLDHAAALGPNRQEADTPEA